MTSPKKNTTILYIILLVVGLIQLVSAAHQIFTEWHLDSSARKTLLILRTGMWITFLTIFSFKLKKILTVSDSNKENINL